MIKQIALLLMISVYAPLAAMKRSSINMQKMNLILAVASHDLPRLQDLFQEYGYNINEPMDRWNRPLLHFAVEHQAIEIVKWLLTIKGININAQSNSGWTALSVSIQKDCVTSNHRLNIPIIKMLLAAGANMHIPSIIGRSPLDIVREDLDDDDPDRATVLHLFDQEFTPKPPQQTKLKIPLKDLTATQDKQPAKTEEESEEEESEEENAFPVPSDDRQEPEPLPAPALNIAGQQRSRRSIKRPAWLTSDAASNDDVIACITDTQDSNYKQIPVIKPRPSTWTGSRRYCPPDSPQKLPWKIRLICPAPTATLPDLAWAAPELGRSAEESGDTRVAISATEESPDAVAAYLHFPLSDDDIAAAAEKHGCYLTEEELAQAAADTDNLL